MYLGNISSPTQTDPKEEPLKFKTALGKALGARLVEKEPEVFQQVLGEVGKTILLAAGSHLSNELAKLAVGNDDVGDQVDRGQENQNAHNGMDGHKAVTEGKEEEDDEHLDTTPVVCPVLTCTENPTIVEFEHHMAEKHSEISNR